MATTPLFGFFPGMPGPGEMVIILMIGVLLFGKRLPDVGRSLGKGLMEFKRGVRGIEEEIDVASITSETGTPKQQPHEEDRDEATAPKFEPPASEPQTQTAAE